MKRKQHSSKVLQFAANLASRESGFIFALLGVLVQASHTWFISYELSSFDGFLRLVQAGLMAFFLSAALLYFTLKSSDDDSDAAKRYRTIVWWFAIIECVINLYYWAQHLVVEPWPNAQWSRFIIAVPFSVLLPFTLKAYSSEVRTDDFSEEDDEDENTEPTDDLSDAQYKDTIDEIVDERFRNFIASLEANEVRENIGDGSGPIETLEHIVEPESSTHEIEELSEPGTIAAEPGTSETENMVNETITPEPNETGSVAAEPETSEPEEKGVPAELMQNNIKLTHPDETVVSKQLSYPVEMHEPHFDPAEPFDNSEPFVENELFRYRQNNL